MAPFRPNSVINMKTSPINTDDVWYCRPVNTAQKTLARLLNYRTTGATPRIPNLQDYQENLLDNRAVYYGNLCSMNVPRHHSQAKLSVQSRAGLPHFLFL